MTELLETKIQNKTGIDLKKESFKYRTLKQFINFTVYNYFFLIDINVIESIIRYVQITKLINVPDYIKGVINLRGNVVPVLSLRKKFSLPEKKIDNTTRIIIIKYEKKLIGFIVDNVLDVKYIDPKEIKKIEKFSGNYKSYSASEAVEINGNINLIIEYKKILKSSGI